MTFLRPRSSHDRLCNASGSRNAGRLTDGLRRRIVAVWIATGKGVRGLTNILGAIVLLVAGGCQIDAPIHVWRAASIEGVSDHKIVLMPIEGEPAMAERVTGEIWRQAKQLQQPGGQLKLAMSPHLVAPERLDSQSVIRLVSAEEPRVPTTERPDHPVSELEMAAVARRQGVPYLLRGQLIQATGQQNTAESLAIAWRLVGLQPGTSTLGRPISVNQQFIADKYPEYLSILDPQERLIRAAASESLSLLSPIVSRTTARLNQPRLLPGSRAVRDANRLAQAGNWPAAEQAWLNVLAKHPNQTAARINTAIAAAARQDFKEAKTRLTEAMRRSLLTPRLRKIAEETLVWVELQQRDYHQAFDLPDPVDGWRVLNVSK